MMMRLEDNLKGLDRVIIICVLILVSVGLMALYSATASNETSDIFKDRFFKQVLWFLLGVMIAAAVVFTRQRVLTMSAYWLYGLGLVLLVLVLFVGGGKGVHRWLIFGPIRFQASEFAKITTILALARYLSEETRDLRKVKDIVLAFAIVVIPALLILKEPDLGTTFVLLATILPVLFWAGLSPFAIFLMLSPPLVVVSAFNIYTFASAIVTVTAILFFTKRRLPILLAVFVLNVSAGAITPKLWDRLHEYQKTRILTFLGLQDDPRGTGYQVAQSQVAIGSGGFWGKGWAKGTQTKLQFLPEQHTDFIFSVIGEEFGFLGVTILLLTFLVLLWRSLQIAVEVNNKFMMLVVAGCVTLLAIHIIVNIGMTVGIMPVTGIPLPFLSYGGSALWSNMTLVALILNASASRYKY